MSDSSDGLFDASDSFWDEVANCVERVVHLALDDILAEDDPDLEGEAFWDSVEDRTDQLISLVVEAIFAPENPPQEVPAAQQSSLTSWSTALDEFAKGLALLPAHDCVVDSSEPLARPVPSVSDVSSLWRQFAPALSCERGTLPDLLLQASLQERQLSDAPQTRARDIVTVPGIETADGQNLEGAVRLSRGRRVADAVIRSERSVLSKQYFGWRRWGLRRALWYLHTRVHAAWRGSALGRLTSELEALSQLVDSLGLPLSDWTTPSLSDYLEAQRDSVRVTRIRIFYPSETTPSGRHVLSAEGASDVTVFGPALRFQREGIESTPDVVGDPDPWLDAVMNAWIYLVIVDGAHDLTEVDESELGDRLTQTHPGGDLIYGLRSSFSPVGDSDGEARRRERRRRVTLDGQIMVEVPEAQAGGSVLRPGGLETDCSSDSSYRLCKGASYYVSPDDVKWWKWERPPADPEFNDGDVTDACDPANA